MLSKWLTIKLIKVCDWLIKSGRDIQPQSEINDVIAMRNELLRSLEAQSKGDA